MSKSRRQRLRELIETSEGDITKINEFFTENISDDELLTLILNTSQDKEVSFGESLADKVAEFGGSWTFIITFFGLLTTWILINVYLLAQTAFDPYPFILLNLILSCLAAIQAPIIMMSQNRKEDKDRKRAQNDYLINLKAELEIKNLQLNMKNLFEIQKKQMQMLEKLMSRNDSKIG
ncbi:MAG: DUF1003 domain-containing protein [Bacteroidetes bacterium]|nr:DUF1003 domain-containing protein [Bacteroidota bacterium]